MKFTVSFKYQKVTFRHKITREELSYDNKAEEGVSFTFENVDETFAINILKGIKNAKAADMFSDSEFRNAFVSGIAKNKSKDLYQKLDTGAWKLEDIQVASITIRDFELLKPTPNARGPLVLESTELSEPTTNAAFQRKDLVAIKGPKFKRFSNEGVILRRVNESTYEVGELDELTGYICRVSVYDSADLERTYTIKHAP